MAIYEERITGDFKTIVHKIEKEIVESSMTMKLVDESNYEIKDTKVAIRVYDKYFMRNGNRASLSLAIVGAQDEVFISAIGSGGGQGIIFNFSLGAETKMVDVVSDCVERLKE